jgi:putative FmdB family regulatory protein
MPTYLYKCPKHGEFEWQHSINDKLEICPFCQDECSSDLILGERCLPQKVERLIAGGAGFILSDGGVGWAKNSYSK